MISESEVMRVLDYFAVFSYAPTLKQIHTFYNQQVSIADLSTVIDKMVEMGLVISHVFGDEQVYSHPGQTRLLKIRNTRHKYSVNKLNKALKVTNILKHLPQVKLIGLTGSVAMNNAKINDDIDFFIVAKKREMWTCRLLVLFILQIMGLRRGRGDKKVCDKICCNLFFDERNLIIPTKKRSYYTAHELIQMVPMKGGETYSKLIKSNKWIYKYFPNASGYMFNVAKKLIKSKPAFILNIVSLFEPLWRFIQLRSILIHKKNELITSTQLWFFPNDAKMKLPEQFWI